MPSAAMKRDSLSKSAPSWENIFVGAVLVLLAAHAQGFVFRSKPDASFVPAGGINHSEFGFSLAYFESANKKEKLFLVGSPGKDNSSGALYSCPVTAIGSSALHKWPCSALPIGDPYLGVQYDDICESNIHHQRLGTSLTVLGEDIMVCAPNWMNTCTKPFGDKYSMLIGTCYVSNGVQGPFTNFTPVYYYNTQSSPRYYIKDGFCQAGFSVAFTQKEQDGLVVGAPGCHSWIGDVFWVDQHDPTSLRRRGTNYTLEEAVQGSISSTPLQLKDRYMGYTVAEGVFSGRQMVVASAPKEGVMTNRNDVAEAAAYVFDKEGTGALRTWATLFPGSEKEWKFAYCGFSLAVVDLDGDGLDDVAVGCPHYGSDRGAFVVFYQRGNGGTYKMEKEVNAFPEISDENQAITTHPDARHGRVSERFASAMAGIGDADGDGHSEFAVGAPGANGGRGRVYIFCGQEGGLSVRPCQELVAADTLRNLGLALASGSGLLAVSMGNPEAVAVYSRRRAMLPNLEVRTEVQLPVLGSKAVPVLVCLIYTYRDDAVDHSAKKFLTYLELDVGATLARLQFQDLPANRTRSFYIEAVADKEECVPFQVMKKTESSDLVSYKLRANTSLEPPESTEVVVDPRLLLEHTAVLAPEVLCDDVKCETKVVVSMQHEAANYVYSPKEKLLLAVRVDVSADPAYFPVLSIDTHGALSYSAVTGTSGLQCDGTTLFSCRGDILEEPVEVTFTLLPSQEMQRAITAHSPQFSVSAAFSSASEMLAVSRPNASVTIPVVLRVDFVVAGTLNKESLTKGSPETLNATFELTNKNEYSYDVDFIIAPLNQSAGCVSDLQLLEHSGACVNVSENADEGIRCAYEHFAAGGRKAVVVSALFQTHDACVAPLWGVATFPRLPFGLSVPSRSAVVAVTITDDVEMWYEKWWVWVLVGVAVALLILNVVIFILCRKQPPAAPPADADQEPQAGQEAEEPLRPKLHGP